MTSPSALPGLQMSPPEVSGWNCTAKGRLTLARQPVVQEETRQLIAPATPSSGSRCRSRPSRPTSVDQQQGDEGLLVVEVARRRRAPAGAPCRTSGAPSAPLPQLLGASADLALRQAPQVTTLPTMSGSDRICSSGPLVDAGGRPEEIVGHPTPEDPQALELGAREDLEVHAQVADASAHEQQAPHDLAGVDGQRTPSCTMASASRRRWRRG